MESATRSLNVAVPDKEIAFQLTIISQLCKATLSILRVVKSKDILAVLSLLSMPPTKSSIFANTRQLHSRQ